MIKPEQVPKDALLSFLDEYNWGNGGEDWARNCIAAAINAWPDAFQWTFNGPLSGNSYILPISQEKNDD